MTTFPGKALACALACALLAAALFGCQVSVIPAPAPSPPAAASGAQAASLEEARVLYVVDGDTIDVSAAGEERRVRLIGIDCPESASRDAAENTPEGEEAAAFTRSLLPEGKVVFLQRDVSETDKYGRHLCYVWLEKPADPTDEREALEKMLNARIVAAGYAQAKRYPPDTAYAGLLEEAQRAASESGAGVSRLWA